MRDGPLAGERFEVAGEMVLGRTNADITIEDPLISRRHAIVRANDSTLEIEDLGSLNGTVVNSEKLEGPRRLQPGDVIMVGATTIEVEGSLVPSGSRTVLAAAPPIVSEPTTAIEPEAAAPRPAPAPASAATSPAGARAADSTPASRRGRRAEAGDGPVCRHRRLDLPRRAPLG